MGRGGDRGSGVAAGDSCSVVAATAAAVGVSAAVDGFIGDCCKRQETQERETTSLVELQPFCCSCRERRQQLNPTAANYCSTKNGEGTDKKEG